MRCCLPTKSLPRTKNGPAFSRKTSRPRRSTRSSSNNNSGLASQGSMAIHVALHHQTRHRYDRRVSLGPHIIRLRPAPHCRTPILAYSLKVLPKNHFINWQQDPQSNYLARLDLEDHRRVDLSHIGEFASDVDLPYRHRSIVLAGCFPAVTARRRAPASVRCARGLFVTRVQDPYGLRDG